MATIYQKNISGVKNAAKGIFNALTAACLGAEKRLVFPTKSFGNELQATRGKDSAGVSVISIKNHTPVSKSCSRVSGRFSFQQGFTLIELLVVVLIIGILSAIALPQYRKAVAKARISEGIIKARALLEALNRYQMQSGEAWTSDLSALDIQISDTWDCGNNYCGINETYSGARLETKRQTGNRLSIFCLAAINNQLANEVCRSATNGTIDHTDSISNFYLIYDPKAS